MNKMKEFVSECYQQNKTISIIKDLYMKNFTEISYFLIQVLLIMLIQVRTGSVWLLQMLKYYKLRSKYF